MDLFDEELVRLFTEFHKNNFRYILVGGFAVNIYGYNRTTGDVDIWMEDNIENRKVLRKVLAVLEYGDMQEIETVPLIPRWTTIALDSNISLDLMSEIKGFSQNDFENCYELATVNYIHNIPVRFLNYNHLILAKKATARPKDILDIEELERIRKSNENNTGWNL